MAIRKVTALTSRVMRDRAVMARSKIITPIRAILTLILASKERITIVIIPRAHIMGQQVREVVEVMTNKEYYSIGMV